MYYSLIFSLSYLIRLAVSLFNNVVLLSLQVTFFSFSASGIVDKSTFGSFCIMHLPRSSFSLSLISSFWLFVMVKGSPLIVRLYGLLYYTTFIDVRTANSCW